jgi:hypothetical protein
MNSNIHNLFGQKTRRLRLVLLFANNWSSDLIYGCFRSLAKKFPIKNFALGIIQSVYKKTYIKSPVEFEYI